LRPADGPFAAFAFTNITAQLLSRNSRDVYKVLGETSYVNESKAGIMLGFATSWQDDEIRLGDAQRFVLWSRCAGLMDVDLMEMKTQTMVGQRFGGGDHPAVECGIEVGIDNGRRERRWLPNDPARLETSP
jgi:hypothetical protein